MIEKTLFERRKGTETKTDRKCKGKINKNALIINQ